MIVIDKKEIGDIEEKEFKKFLNGICIFIILFEINLWILNVFLFFYRIVKYYWNLLLNILFFKN